MTILGIPTPTTVKSTWSPFSASANGVYSRILQDASTFATIITPTQISGYYGDIFSSDSTFTLSSTKQGVTVSADDMNTITPGTAQVFHLFVSSFAGGPTDAYGIGFDPIGGSVYDVIIGDPFNNPNNTVFPSIEILTTDKITVAIDNTGAHGGTVYAYKNGTLIGSHELLITLVNPLESFVTLISCYAPAITVTADMDYAVSDVTNYIGASGVGSEVDPASYPVNAKRNAYEIADLGGPMTITGLGAINNYDVVVFGENAEPIQIIKSTVESVTSSSGAIVVDNTDPLNPVLSVKADGSSSDYLNASGTYTTVTVPVTSITAGTDISVTESPTGTFTIANTQTVPVQSLVAGTNISVTESPTGTFTIANTDILTSSITDGDTTHAPNGNVVYDALALKLNATSPSFGTSLSGTLALHGLYAPPSIAIQSADADMLIRAFTPINDPVAQKSFFVSIQNSSDGSRTSDLYSSMLVSTGRVGASVVLSTGNSTLAASGKVTTNDAAEAILQSRNDASTVVNTVKASPSGITLETLAGSSADIILDSANIISMSSTNGDVTIGSGVDLNLNATGGSIYLAGSGFITADAYTIDLTATTAIHLNSPNVLANGSHIQTLNKHVTTVSSSSGVVTIDLSAVYSHYILTLTENVTSWVFTNVPASGYFKELYITIIQHASSAKTAVSPASAGRTAGGIAWIADTRLSSRELLVAQFNSDSTVDLFPTGAMV